MRGVGAPGSAESRRAPARLLMGTRKLLALVLLVTAVGGGLWWLTGDGGRRGPRGTGPGAVGRAAPAAGGRVGPPGGDPSPMEPVGERSASRAARGTAAVTPSAGATWPHDAPERVLRGRVLSADGAPVAGADVSSTPGLSEATALLARDAPGDARTDADGRFELRGTLGDPFTLEVHAAGFAPFRRAVWWRTDTRTMELAPVRLARSPVVAGRVVDLAGAPIADARLLVVPRWETGELDPLGWERPALARSDAAGSFRVDRLAPGRWRLRVVAQGFVEGRLEGTTPAGERSVGHVVRLGRGATIGGVVAGLPPAGELPPLRVLAEPQSTDALLLAGPHVAPVDESGRFVVDGLAPDATVSLVLAREGDPPFGTPLAERVTARAGEQGVRLDYRPPAALRFQVVDAASGAPVTGYRARAGIGALDPLRDADGRERLQHAEGRAAFTDLRPPVGGAEAALLVESVGYAPLARDGLRVVPGGVLDLGVLELARVPLVEVTVVAVEDGRPIEGALVSLWPEEAEGRGEGAGSDVDRAHHARSDAYGIAVLSSHPGRRCTLHVAAAGRAPAVRRELLLPREADHALTVALGTGGTVLVRVRQANGTPRAGARVGRLFLAGQAPAEPTAGARSATEPSEARPTDLEGVVRFRHLAPGVHGFAVLADHSWQDLFGDDPSWTRSEVRPGTTTELTLIVPTLCALSGRVLEGGVRLADAELWLVPRAEEEGAAAVPWGALGPVRTDSDGLYRFEDVRVGRYGLVLRHADRHVDTRLEILLQDGENALDLQLPLASVRGVVRTADGRPVEGAEVRVVLADGEEGDLFPEDGPSVRSAADGSYALLGLVPDRELWVEALHPEFQVGRSRGTLRLEEDAALVGVDVVMEPGATIRTRVVHAGQPAQLGTLLARWVPGDGEAAGPVADRLEVPVDGLAVLRGLRPGTWRLVYSPPGGAPVPPTVGDDGAPLGTTITVGAGELVDVTLLSG